MKLPNSRKKIRNLLTYYFYFNGTKCTQNHDWIRPVNGQQQF